MKFNIITGCSWQTHNHNIIVNATTLADSSKAQNNNYIPSAKVYNNKF